MNQPSKKSKDIVDAFRKYSQTGDKSLIEAFSLEDIQLALAQYHDRIGRTFTFYDAMEKRAEDLNERRRPSGSSKEKWKDRVITAAITFFITIIGGLLVLHFSGFLNLMKLFSK